MIPMEWFMPPPKVLDTTKEYFWQLQRDLAERTDMEYVAYLKEHIKFATPGQLEGARLYVERELYSVLTPPEHKHYIQTYIEPIIRDAIENHVDSQLNLF